MQRKTSQKTQSMKDAFPLSAKSPPKISNSSSNSLSPTQKLNSKNSNSSNKASRRKRNHKNKPKLQLLLVQAKIFGKQTKMMTPSYLYRSARLKKIWSTR